MPKKLRAGILAATGTVGQRFIELLANHPNSRLQHSPHPALRPVKRTAKPVRGNCRAIRLRMSPRWSCRNAQLNWHARWSSVLFSPTKRAIANRQFASAGHKIFTNASAHRMQARGIVYGESTSRNQNHYQCRKRTRAGSSAPVPRRIAPTLATARGGDAPD
jgi:aspartate-semialdehyde dehydrogenase